MLDAIRKRRADSLSSEGRIARRPTLFRALGRREPPLVIELHGHSYQRVEILKHDSWAASALYSDDCGSRVACKFNRIHPLLTVPMAWLGRYLARREQRVLQLMHDSAGFPRWAGAVSANGQVLAHAVAHAWIEAETFKPWVDVDEHFFPRLRAMVAELHSRDLAYVDMSKWENILVGADGRPYLIDYQIHFRLPCRRPLRWLLRWLQAADLYYLHRHWMRVRPDQLLPEHREWLERPPRIVWIAEALGPIWRAFRLFVLRLFGVHGDPRRAAGPSTRSSSDTVSVSSDPT